jgi:prevent-host-death family protein
MVNMITLKALRPGLPEVIERIDAKFDRYVVTRRGKPVCVMMSVEDYEAMVETMEILSDKPLVKRIRKAEADYKAGKAVPLGMALKELEHV